MCQLRVERCDSYHINLSFDFAFLRTKSFGLGCTIPLRPISLRSSDLPFLLRGTSVTLRHCLSFVCGLFPAGVNSCPYNASARSPNTGSCASLLSDPLLVHVAGTIRPGAKQRPQNFGHWVSDTPGTYDCPCVAPNHRPGKDVSKSTAYIMVRARLYCCNSSK
jgi:hypothetical protein